MEENIPKTNSHKPRLGQGEDDLGIFGPPVTEADLRRAREEARRELLDKNGG